MWLLRLKRLALLAVLATAFIFIFHQVTDEASGLRQYLQKDVGDKILGIVTKEDDFQKAPQLFEEEIQKIKTRTEELVTEVKALPAEQAAIIKRKIYQNICQDLMTDNPASPSADNE